MRKNNKRIVLGEGPRNAKIMFIGEAPGAEEEKEGRPFVGRAGRLLTKLLEEINIKRKDVYITNVVKIRPRGNRRPNRKEINYWKPYLLKEIKLIKPKIIVLLGNTAVQTMLGKLKLAKIHGKRIKRENIIFIPTYHPSAAMRFPKIKKIFTKDFMGITR